MESKLRDAIAKGETILPQLWRLAGTLPIGIDEYKDAIESLLSLARTYLAVVEKGVLGFDEEAKKSDHYCPTCHAWYKKQMTSLLVEKEKEIARLSKEVNDLDHGLHKHQDPHWKMWERVLAEKKKEAMEFRGIVCTQQKEIEDLESQLVEKEREVEELKDERIKSEKEWADKCMKLEHQLSNKMTPEPIFITNHQDRVKHFDGCQCPICLGLKPEDKKYNKMTRERVIKVIDDYGEKFSKAGVLPKAGELADLLMAEWEGK
jgi:DNA repair exonuclease SbcCD ATPase subunit